MAIDFQAMFGTLVTPARTHRRNILADPNDVDELYLYGDWEQSPMPPLRRFTAFSMSRHMVMETPVELRVQWPASLAPLVGALECLGLTLSDADNTILCTENLFFGALKTLQLDVRHSTMTGGAMLRSGTAYPC